MSILGVLLSSSNRITYLESALEMSQLGPVATTIMLGMTPETFPVLIHCGQSSPGMWHCPSQSVCGGPLVALFLLAREAPVLPALPQDKCHMGQWDAHNMQASPW